MAPSSSSSSEAWSGALPAVAAVSLLLVIGTSLFYGLGRWPLVEPDEGRNAEVAREMIADGHWIVPHFDGLPFLDKPAALFWLIAGAFSLLGESELAARLPSVTATVALILLTFAIGRMLLDGRRAALAAAVVATSPLVLIFGRLTIFDMPLTALVTLALACLVRARLGGRAIVWLPLAALAMGLGTLTKGPVGFVVPLLAWLAARGALAPPAHRSRRGPIVMAAVVFAMVVLPWLVSVSGREPTFLRYALFDETLLRFTSPERFNRGGPIYYHLVALALGLGVWTAVLGAVGSAIARCAAGPSTDARGVRFAARATLAILVFFTVCASKRPGYILPAFVPMSLLIAAGVHAATRTAAAAIRVVGTGALATGLFVAVATITPADARAVLPPLGQASPALGKPVLIAGSAALAAWGLAVLCIPRARPVVTLALGAVFGPALYLSLLGPLTPYAEYRSTREIARHIDPEIDVIAFQVFRTSLPFYLKRPILLASRSGAELTSNYLVTQDDRFSRYANLMRPRDLWKRLRDGRPAYVLTKRGPKSEIVRSKAPALVGLYGDRRTQLFGSRSSPARTRNTLSTAPGGVP